MAILGILKDTLPDGYSLSSNRNQFNECSYLSEDKFLIKYGQQYDIALKTFVFEKILLQIDEFHANFRSKTNKFN